MSENICECKFQKAKKCYEVVHSWFDNLNKEPFDTLPHNVKYAWLMIALGKRQHIIPSSDEDNEKESVVVQEKKPEVGELLQTPYDEETKKRKSKPRKK